MEFFKITINPSTRLNCSSIAMNLAKPTPRWVELKIYGSSFGIWVKSFTWSLGHKTSVLPELSALKDGLLLALNLGLSSLHIDAKCIVNMPRNNQAKSLLMEPMFLHWRNLLKMIPNKTKLSMFYRGAKQCTHLLLYSVW